MKIKVRFNLSAGENFMKWKIEGEKGSIYLDPNKHSLTLFNATLKNRKKGAKKIIEGSNKFVVAWVECDRVAITEVEQTEIMFFEKGVFYNPKKHVHWFDSAGKDLDNENFGILQTIGNKIFK